MLECADACNVRDICLLQTYEKKSSVDEKGVRERGGGEKPKSSNRISAPDDDDATTNVSSDTAWSSLRMEESFSFQPQKTGAKYTNRKY